MRPNKTGRILVAWRHQPIAWMNIDLTSVMAFTWGHYMKHFFKYRLAKQDWIWQIFRRAMSWYVCPVYRSSVLAKWLHIIAERTSRLRVNIVSLQQAFTVINTGYTWTRLATNWWQAKAPTMLPNVQLIVWCDLFCWTYRVFDFRLAVTAVY